jgi:hypothetical protein
LLGNRAALSICVFPFGRSGKNSVLLGTATIQSSLASAENPQLYQRTKHEDEQYHYFPEPVTEGLADLWYILTLEMMADRLAKLLALVKYKEFVKQL